MPVHRGAHQERDEGREDREAHDGVLQDRRARAAVPAARCRAADEGRAEPAHEDPAVVHDPEGVPLVRRRVQQTQLRAQEKELTLTPTPEDEYVGILIGGLRAGYNVLTNSWALDEVRGAPQESEAEVEDAAPPIRAKRLRIKKKKSRNA